MHLFITKFCCVFHLIVNVLETLKTECIKEKSKYKKQIEIHFEIYGKTFKV